MIENIKKYIKKYIIYSVEFNYDKKRWEVKKDGVVLTVADKKQFSINDAKQKAADEWFIYHNPSIYRLFNKNSKDILNDMKFDKNHNTSINGV